MSQPFEHGIDYSEIDNTLRLREMLRLSQSNITADHMMGLRYAAAAFDKATTQSEDPTAEAEAAAKAGLRAAQTGQFDKPQTLRWFDQANMHLPHTTLGRREKIAVDQLEARSRAIFMGRAILGNNNGPSELAYETYMVESKFRTSINAAEDPRDPYLTLTFRHFSTFEAMVGRPIQGALLAIRGIGSAVIAREEKANQDPGATILSRGLARATFIAKQILSNSMAGALSVTSPIRKIPRAGKIHTKAALKMLS